MKREVLAQDLGGPARSWRSTLGATLLAGVSSAAAVWMVIEGQAIHTQSVILQETQTHVRSLSAESAAAQQRLDAVRATLREDDDRWTKVKRELSRAEIARAEAVRQREQAEDLRASAEKSRASTLKWLDEKAARIEQSKAETAAAEISAEVAKAELVATMRENQKQRAVRDGLVAENAALAERQREYQATAELLKPQLESLSAKRTSLEKELEQRTDTSSRLRESLEREQAQLLDGRQEAALLVAEAERLRRETEQHRKELSELQRQKPTLQAQVQALQQQVHDLDTGARRRNELVAQLEARVTDAVARGAELEARRAAAEEKLKEHQEQARDHARRAAEAKGEADRASVELTRTQDQLKRLDAQRRELSRIGSLKEEAEAQLAELDQKLAAKRRQLSDLLNEAVAVQEQRQEAARLARDVGLIKGAPTPAAVETTSSTSSLKTQ
jgi:fused signal recognition particle receptor